MGAIDTFVRHEQLLLGTTLYHGTENEQNCEHFHQLSTILLVAYEGVAGRPKPDNRVVFDGVAPAGDISFLMGITAEANKRAVGAA